MMSRCYRYDYLQRNSFAATPRRARPTPSCEKHAFGVSGRVPHPPSGWAHRFVGIERYAKGIT